MAGDVCGILATLSHIIRRRLAFAAVIVGFIVVGASGFRYFEDSRGSTVFIRQHKTVTTVGYGDLTPVTKGGRFFAILLMLTGAGTVLYALTVLAQAVIQSEMVHGLDRRRKLKEMEKLEGHYIVCGAGRVGRRILLNLERQNLPHVIIERRTSAKRGR
ncbi:MAG: hypothetical protein IPG67_06140 [Acidobacteria bacterium]|nr:hypothetical protein [Acidobacteriota bacterium]